MTDLHCLALNLYHEARGEPFDGIIAVGMVTLNRVRSAAYPNTICDVVWEKQWSKRYKRFIAEFSWTLDSLSDIPQEQHAWQKSTEIANQLLNGQYPNPMKQATNYHADYVSPAWSKKLTFIKQIGLHRFYY